MAVRKNALDVSVFTIGGQDFLGSTKSWDFQLDVTDDDCRVASERYHTSVPVKKKLEFSIERIPHVANVCQSNLTASVYTVGGTSYLGELESGSISITTDTVDGSGVADIWEFPNAVGTDLEIKTNVFVTSNSDLFQLAAENNITSVQVVVVLTIGGTSVEVNANMTAASLRIEEGQLQMQDVTFKLQGEPEDASGDAVVLEILTGDSFVQWAIDTDAGAFTGDAIITQTDISFSQAQLVSMSHTLANQGQPSITAA